MHLCMHRPQEESHAMTQFQVPTSNRSARAASMLTLAVALSAVPAVGQAPPETVTLERAIERALQHSPQLAQAAAGAVTAEWSERRAGAAYLPSLSLGTGAGLSGTTGVGAGVDLPASTRESYSAGVSASLDVFTGGRRGAESDRARADTHAARASLTERRYGVVLSTQRAFFEAARAADLVAVADARVEAATQSLDAAERRMKVGSATHSDVLRAQLELSRARQAQLEAQNQVRTTTLVLGRAVGADHAVGVVLGEAERTVRPLSLGEAEMVALVVGAAPTVDAAEATLRAAQAGTRVASSQYLPRISLSSGYDWSSQQASWASGNTGWSLRLGLSLPLFDNYHREAGLADARNRTGVAELQLADARRVVRVEAERLVAAVRLAEQRITLAEEGVRVAEEDLRVQQIRYQVAASTMLDQLASQTAAAEARQNLVGARYDYQIARAELEALAGRPL
jgi:outer membrane protein